MNCLIGFMFMRQFFFFKNYITFVLSLYKFQL